MATHERVAVRLDGITKRFGDVVANDDVDFTLRRGTVHALLGENGSGKTTLMSVLYGLYDQDDGRIYLDGEPQAFASPRDAIDAGIGMIHQHFQLVPTMTVLQNVVLGHEPTDGWTVDEATAREEIGAISRQYDFGLEDVLDAPVRDVDLGTRQRVEIVKSLYRGADVLILDEPTAVLTPQEVEGLFDLLEELVDQGRSLVFITHKLDEAMAAADEVTVLRDGEVVGTVDAGRTSREELARMMVGREIQFERRVRGDVVGDTVLSVSNLQVEDDRGLPAVRDVSFDVRAGEIFGIAGIQGNGQTELVEALTGMREVDAGAISFQRTDVTDWSRRERIEAGIAYVPADRQTEGLVLGYDLVGNALLGNQTIEPFARGGFVDWDAVRAHAEDVVEEYDVQPATVDVEARSLSGGNQQKFVVGREINRDPEVVIASQPTRGVDIGAIEFIHDRLVELREEGLAVVVVSSKLQELRELSDRVAVLYEGSFVDVVDPETVTEADLGLLMTGHDPDEVRADGENARQTGDTAQTGDDDA